MILVRSIFHNRQIWNFDLDTVRKYCTIFLKISKGSWFLDVCMRYIHILQTALICSSHSVSVSTSVMPTSTKQEITIYYHLLAAVILMLCSLHWQCFSCWCYCYFRYIHGRTLRPALWGGLEGVHLKMANVPLASPVHASLHGTLVSPDDSK